MVTTAATPALAGGKQFGYCEAKNQPAYHGQGWVYYHEDSRNTFVDSFDATQTGGGNKSSVYFRLMALHPIADRVRYGKKVSSMKSGRNYHRDVPESARTKRPLSEKLYVRFEFDFDKDNRPNPTCKATTPTF
jgi:hypothetical protein